MRDYWLAKLISSVTEVDSRKRLQKSIYLLQRAGCPLHLNYIFHYYGPYSFELAGLIDQLDGAHIIDETADVLSPNVVRYKSAITSRGEKVLKNFEKTKDGKQAMAKITPFTPRFKDLNEEDPWVLELAATVAYFNEGNWTEAQKQTVIFKKLPRNDSKLKQALELAKDFKPSG
jgi:uncharacterized protein YwgA